MKEFIKSFIIVLIIQLISWVLFISCDFIPVSINNKINISLSLNIIISLICIILYYTMHNKLISKYNLKSLKFNIFLFIIWNILSIGFMYLVLYLVDMNILHSTNSKSIYNGLEYVTIGFTYCLTSIIIISGNIIKKLIKLIKDK